MFGAHDGLTAVHVAAAALDHTLINALSTSPHWPAACDLGFRVCYRPAAGARDNDCIINIILVKPNHISHHSSTAVMEKVPKEVVPVR